jgi:nucleotide-binding universal stress UspA family protein
MNTRKRPGGAVVVGIGPDGSHSALAWAVRECTQRQLPLHLVHAFGYPDAVVTSQTHKAVLERAEKVLDEAVTEARKGAEGQVQVTSELDGDHEPTDSLVRCAEHAALVVLEHRALGPVHRALTGSFVNGVASRSSAPVASVAEGWDATSTGVVTMAVQDPDDAPALLDAAGEAARARGGKVQIVHAWWLNSGYDTVAVDDEMRQQRSGEVHTWLDPVVARYHERHGDVPVSVAVRHAPPLEAILDAAEGSDLLVVGRRHHLLPRGSHLGPVARAVLDHTRTPVLVLGKSTGG